MDWTELKNKIYVWEGGWLDIHVHETTSKDWEKWTQFVNKNFRIEWYNGKNERDETKIDFTVIQEFWDGNHDLTSIAKVFVEDIQVNAHFFDDSEIENDIDPREFETIGDHHKLIRYLMGISKILKKEVTVTPENCPEIILMKVNGESVVIITDSDPKEWPLRMKK